MKKIGIVTLNGYRNYGNRLQNYALYTYLNKRNLKVYNIWKYDFKESIVSHIKMLIPTKKYLRFRKFYIFNKFINTKYIFDYKKIKNAFDFFVVGSDQVWNPDFAGDDEFFLNFADDSKKISYAASVGTETIPKDVEDKYICGWKKFKMISVREDAAKRLIHSNTGRNDIFVNIDPTLLLDIYDWNKVLKKPKTKIPNKYILCYFLGDISEKRKEIINCAAKKYGCDVIYLLDRTSKFYNTGPSEFLYLEKNAFLICTDSFHSSVFAILYKLSPFFTV